MGWGWTDSSSSLSLQLSNPNPLQDWIRLHGDSLPVTLNLSHFMAPAPGADSAPDSPVLSILGKVGLGRSPHFPVSPTFPTQPPPDGVCSRQVLPEGASLSHASCHVSAVYPVLMHINKSPDESAVKKCISSLYELPGAAITNYYKHKD